MLRTLTHYWPLHLAVILAAAVSTAILTGALLVGDSVRGSLRAMTLERLGGIDSALVARRFFREDLADAIPGSAPAIVLRGSVREPGSGARASGVAIHGVDGRFTALFGRGGPPLALDLERPPGAALPPAVVNDSLARELGVKAGDALVLSFGRGSTVPRGTLMGRKDIEAVLGSARFALAAVIPDRGLGRFGLEARQQSPRNVFVSLEHIQRSLGERGRVNALLSDEPAPDAAARLGLALSLEDLGLALHDRGAYASLESHELVLGPAVDRAAGELAAELGLPVQRIQSYLLNTVRLGERLLPYSLVAAVDLDPELPWATLQRIDGNPAPPPAAGEVLLNEWAARDLGAGPGDEVEVTYFTVGPREELVEEKAHLAVASVVAIRGLGADRTLTPDYPGIQDARNLVDWSPPFPVDFSLIRPEDEHYWDTYGATPKAFVSGETGRRLWTTRFGSTTSVRFGVGEANTTAEAEIRRLLRERLEPEAFGFRFAPVKQEGLAAAAGATDFAGLFLAFSSFLIVSAAMLVGLLFRLGVEQRSREVGLLLAVGHRTRAVRRRLVLEGLVLAGIGATAGLAGGVAYAALLMAGLRTLWRPAVGSSELALHVQTGSLVLGPAIAIVVVLASIVLAVGRLVRLLPALLAGSVGEPSAPQRQSRFASLLAAVAIIAAAALVTTTFATGAAASPGLAFGAGALLLIAGLALFARWCRVPGSGRSMGLAAMAARQSAWRPGRSLLSVCLVAVASFVIVVVAANRAEPAERLASRESGSGGFALVAEADVPLHQNLNERSDRLDLGFSEAAAADLEGVDVFALRLLPGDDASCLNLYRPESPRIVGVTPEFIERGGFTFAQHLALADGQKGTGHENPWTLLDATHELEPGVVAAIGDANSVRWILHLGLGDELTIEDERGDPLRLRLVGLLERSVFQGELLISERSFLEHFPSKTGAAYFLIDAPRERAQHVAQLLESTLAPFGFDATTTADKIASYMTVENTYLATFQLLGGLGLLLGTVGLGVVLVRNVIERRGELAVLRAFGFRRSVLAWLVVGETVFLVLVGLAIGTVAALAAAAPRLAGSGLPWASLLATMVLVVLVGLVASAAAVLGIVRVPLLPTLKAER